MSFLSTVKGIGSAIGNIGRNIPIIGGVIGSAIDQTEGLVNSIKGQATARQGSVIEGENNIGNIAAGQGAAPQGPAPQVSQGAQAQGAAVGNVPSMQSALTTADQNAQNANKIEDLYIPEQY